MFAVENVTVSYGNNAILRPTTHTFKRELTTAIIGPSGCGKSTLLRALLGLVRIDSGTIRFGDEIVTSQNIQDIRHRVGYVTQDGGIFPHLSAVENVTLVARMLRKPGAEIARRVEELRTLVGLPEELLRRYPGQLSGGQKQKISLMRALMLDPKVLLLDEPLGALDPISRTQLQDELKRIFTPLHKTVIIVTHDMREAASFGHDIVLMRDGVIVQSGAFEELVAAPREPYVTDFIRAQQLELPA